MNWSLNQVMNWSVNQLMHWSVNQLMNWSLNQVMNWSLHQLIYWSINQSIDQSIDWSVNQLINIGIQNLNSIAIFFIIDYFYSYCLGWILDILLDHNHYFIPLTIDFLFKKLWRNFICYQACACTIYTIHFQCSSRGISFKYKEILEFT